MYVNPIVIYNEIVDSDDILYRFIDNIKEQVLPQLNSDEMGAG